VLRPISAGQPGCAVSYIWTNPETMDIRFPGQWFQLETGLAYNWHRHYDPSLGRYIQPDPIGLAGGGSLYGYVDGNPLAEVDLDGLFSRSWDNPSPLPPEQCRALREKIYEKNELLRQEIKKYDPIKDAQGGWVMKWGSGVTRPGGHYQEIRDLQRGLKSDLETYNKHCKCDGSDGDNLSISRNVDELANRYIPKPPGLSVPFREWLGLPILRPLPLPVIP
jgi:RHS repeat-associated protein